MRSKAANSLSRRGEAATSNRKRKEGISGQLVASGLYVSMADDFIPFFAAYVTTDSLKHDAASRLYFRYANFVEPIKCSK